MSGSAAAKRQAKADKIAERAEAKAAIAVAPPSEAEQEAARDARYAARKKRV